MAVILYFDLIHKNKKTLSGAIKWLIIQGQFNQAYSYHVAQFQH